MKSFALTPADAWFFRDGRPYNEKETNQADVASVFPPPARTLSGALRAALARANGWTGTGPWTPELNRALGSGPNELGALQFTGPFLIKNGQALWPMPRHILGRAKDRWEPATFLRPDENPTCCDAGQINLPVIVLPPEKRDGLKPTDSAWITAPALSALLSGKLPAATDIFTPTELWALEARVGLHRDETKLTTGEGALYSPSYVRLRRGVALGMGIEGVPHDLKAEIPALFPLGGESRLTQCEAWLKEPLPEPPPQVSFKPDDESRIQFTATLLTPGGFQEPKLPGVEVISACVGKPQFIGGWDSLRGEPLPLQPFAPAGSIWFCTANAAEFPATYGLHGKRLGPYAAHGFGQLIIGHWPSTPH